MGREQVGVVELEAIAVDVKVGEVVHPGINRDLRVLSLESGIPLGPLERLGRCVNGREGRSRSVIISRDEVAEREQEQHECEESDERVNEKHPL